MNDAEGVAETPAWRKSSHSVSNGECVEVAQAAGYIMVRDSMKTGRFVLGFTAAEWRAFVYGMKHGYSDRFR